MEQYVRLDVSLKETHFCVMDGAGDVVSRGRDATQPALLAQALARHALSARVVTEVTRQVAICGQQLSCPSGRY